MRELFVCVDAAEEGRFAEGGSVALELYPGCYLCGQVCRVDRVKAVFCWADERWTGGEKVGPHGRLSSAFKRIDDTVKNNEVVERRGKKTMINLFQVGAGSVVLNMKLET